MIGCFGFGALTRGDVFRIAGTQRWCIQNGCLRKCIKRQACLAVRLQDKVKQVMLSTGCTRLVKAENPAGQN